MTTPTDDESNVDRLRNDPVIRERIRRNLLRFPRLTPEQRQRLRELLRPTTR